MKIEFASSHAEVTPAGLSRSATSLFSRLGMFVVFLSCSLAVFMFSTNYYPLFSTNGSLVFSAGLTIFFLVASLLFKRSQKYTKFWPLAYAFFVASAVNLVSILLAGKYMDFVHLFGATSDNKTYALDKVYDTLILLVPAIGLTLLSGADLKSIYLSRGNQYWKWGIGIGALVVADFVTSALIFYGTDYKLSMLPAAIGWGIVFAFSNSLLEELWVRGLFLKKYIPLVGVTGSVLLTSITFASLHFLSVAYLPATVVPIFVINTLAMGLACGILMVKTDSIWGAYLIHAAADFFLFIATLAAR